MPKAKKARPKREAAVYARKHRAKTHTLESETVDDQSDDTMAREVVTKLLSEYSKNANKTRAKEMKKYLRDQFEFFGIGAKDRREIDRKVLRLFVFFHFSFNDDP